MAMTKTEKAAFEKLQRDLALSRAMRWPDYPEPAPMTRAEIEANKVDGGIRFGKAQRVAKGWFQNAYGPRVSYGCSDGVNCNADGDITCAQGMGRMYATKADALRAMRIEMTESFAGRLAAVDYQIAEAEGE